MKFKITNGIIESSSKFSGTDVADMFKSISYVTNRNYKFNTVRVENAETPSGSYPGTQAFVGGVLLPDGRVFCVPYNSTTARIYNPVTDTLTTPSGTYPGSNAFAGGVLLPDGRVFCIPHMSTTSRIYNPVTDTLTTPSGTYPGSGALGGGVLLPDGRVFCVPYNSTTARIISSPASSPMNPHQIPMQVLLSGFLNKL
jgi:hypothetical protein